ncbi:MAG: LPD38 domain-containing protein [Hydrogenophaga sp.]|uniref:LPD38 domain-containing protein n=1 Tax=Hydrogenophaga sp. TaxID=1904254 RepID=UPI0027372969|nr:LPD38 domain-containing protein [Hydrogenophaga sp.]MDP3627119.1 LPD38 domain-containing protein [Hydrogenophaga sp.]
MAERIQGLSEEQFNWVKQLYEADAPNREAAAATAREVSGENLNQMRLQNQLTNDYAAYQKDTRAEKNRVAVSLYGMALSNPNPDFWATIRPGMAPDAIKRELQRMGVDPTVAEAGMQGVPTIQTVDPVLDRVVSRPNPMYKSLPGAIVLKINGEDRVLMLNEGDPRGLRMAESLKNLDGLTRLELASSSVGYATRWLASVNTQYNPAFGLVNLTRDTLGGAINLSSTPLRGKATMVLATTPAAIRGIALELSGRESGEWGKLWRQFQDDGGQTGFRDMFKDANDRTKRLQAELQSLEKAGKLTSEKVAGKVLGSLDIFNTTLENAVRLAAYRQALAIGMSRAESARLGRELTVDFNRKGRTGRELSPLYAFFNASVQGSARTLQTLAGPAGKRIIAGGVALGVVQAVMLLLAGYEDDEIPEFVKSRALIVPLGKDAEGKKKFFTIPYPLGLHVLPNTGRVLAELTLNGGEDAGKRAFEAVGEIAGAFNPLGGGNIFTADGALRTIAPTVLDPLIELSANKNFAGAPIEREPQGENDPRPGFQRAREGTLRTATGQSYHEVSRIINTMTGGSDYEKGLISPTPERLRYLAQVPGGGLLREIEKTVNTTVDAVTGQPVKSSGVPVLGRFYGEVDDANVQRSRYFDNVREIETLERKIKAAENAGDFDAAERMEKEGAVVDAAKEKRRAKKEITELNREAMETIGDREKLRALDDDRTAVMRDLNDEVAAIRREQGRVTPGERLRSLVGVD